MPGTDRASWIGALEAEGLLVTEWTDEPNTVYGEHTHDSSEVRVVIEGSMSVECDGETIVLGPGDRLDIAAGRPHSARVGESGVRYLAAR